MDDEIRKLQQERAKAARAVDKFDSHIYEHDSRDNYHTSISLSYNENEEEEEIKETMNSRKKFLNSFSGSKKFFAETRGDEEDVSSSSYI
jgi:hypothetical protein